MGDSVKFREGIRLPNLPKLSFNINRITPGKLLSKDRQGHVNSKVPAA